MPLNRAVPPLTRPPSPSKRYQSPDPEKYPPSRATYASVSAVPDTMPGMAIGELIRPVMRTLPLVLAPEKIPLILAPGLRIVMTPSMSISLPTEPEPKAARRNPVLP